MEHVPEYHRFVLREIPDLLSGARGQNDELTVLDCGAGRGVWGSLMRGIRIGEKGTIVAVDVYRPFLKFLKHFSTYDDAALSDVGSLPFKDRAFDVVLASEVLEHLPKQNGLKFLQEVERVCKGKIILTTPNGAYQLGERMHSHHVESMEHRSGWSVGELRKLGFGVHGIGFRFFKLYWGYPRVWGALLYFFTPISYSFPRIGEFLIAVKKARQR
jgi:2-polyprenyl-3-methyl-5-hydroxy-6-metoxy-1,4-benzoquinol methylase